MTGVHAAIAGGANRIELCTALALGGLTPPAMLVEAALKAARPAGVAVHAMVRPRAGDFSYDAEELALASADARALVAQGVDGLVFGAVRDGWLDIPALEDWVSAVQAERALALTLHRAVDVTADPVEAVDAAVRLGFTHVLTSGGAVGAPAGAETIARMVTRAGGRCRIMAGAGVRPETAAALITMTGVLDLHASASEPVPSIGGCLAALGFEAPPRRRTDPNVVRALRAVLDRTPPFRPSQQEPALDDR